MYCSEAHVALNLNPDTATITAILEKFNLIEYFNALHTQTHVFSVKLSTAQVVVAQS